MRMAANDFLFQLWEIILLLSMLLVAILYQVLEPGGMIALSQMATFLAVELKDFYGNMAKPREVTCGNLDCSDN